MESTFSLANSVDQSQSDLRLSIAKYVISSTSLNLAVKNIKVFFVAFPQSRKSFEFNKTILEHLINIELIPSTSDLLKTVENLNSFPAFKTHEMNNWLEQQSTRYKNESKLRKAIIEVDFESVEKLLSTNININAKDKLSTYTFVLEAVLKAKDATLDDTIKIVKLLLDKGADVNKASHNLSPIGFACHKGYSKLVELMLENKADPNNLPVPYCPLYLALSNISKEQNKFYNYKHIISLLLAANADKSRINIIEKTGLTHMDCTFVAFNRSLSEQQKEEIISLLKK